jgi:D-alanyl-D-alanine carboxypeptidase
MFKCIFPLFFIFLTYCFSANAYSPDLNYSAILIDAESEEILYEKDSISFRFPASLSKLMVTYIVFSQLKKGKIKMDDKVKITKKAARQEKSNLDLKAGQTFTVLELLTAMEVHSANDAAIALAEHISGTESKFVKLMNAETKNLGLTRTHFMNATGFHNPKQYTTAEDMAKLSRILWKQFPDFFYIFSIRSFAINGKVYKSRNYFLDMYKNAYGMKTGFTNASGYNLSSIVIDNNRVLIAVVLQINKRESRDNFMIKLFDYGFFKLNNKQIHHSISV